MKRIVALLFLFALLFQAFAKNPVKKTVQKEEGFQLIPSATVYTQTYLPGTDSIMLESFFASTNEVTNGQYKSFLADFLAQGDTQAYNQHYPDTAEWIYINSTPMSAYYFQHEAYREYPVVNVKKESAEAYCLWVQQRLIEKLPAFDVSCRLPTKVEWTVLAMGEPNVSTPYPFGYYLRNYKGLFQCNFKSLGDEYINANIDKAPAIAVNVTNYGADGALYTTPSESYSPNGYGLYNICGNVAELVQEDQAMGGSWNSYGYDVRIASSQDYLGPNPTIGFRPILILKKK